jgi:hypothetical protein
MIKQILYSVLAIFLPGQFLIFCCTDYFFAPLMKRMPACGDRRTS